MKYLALYRKYRPDTFTKVVGQDHIVKILSAQVKSKSIGHAYLFCGARGTGKTSVAKIFAKAINCTDNINGSPCNKCISCSGKSSGNMDILEIDAASNNKVEDIREIIENSQYPPVNGSFKIYIIDEVHMLTGQAFNALLKTLEEPPSHAVFILATTEVYKLPATILSRCMRFDFRLIPTAEITTLLKDVFNDIGKPFEEEALIEIARAGEGSVRDALSIADTTLSASSGKLKLSDVLELLAASDRGKVAKLCHCILIKDAGGLLNSIEELASAGKSIAVLNKDLLMYLRDLSVVKSCTDSSGILLFPQEIIEKYSNDIKQYDINKILRCIEIFSSIESELRYSLHPRIIFEAAALKCAVTMYDRGADSFEARISEIEKQLKKLSENGISGVISEKKTEKKEIKNNNTLSQQKAVAEDNCGFDYVLSDNDAPPQDGFEDNIISPEMPKSVNNIPKKEQESQNILPQSGIVGFKKIDRGVIAENVFDKPENESKESGESAESVWGNVIRKLRQEGAGLLYTMCGEMKTKISGKDFMILADNDMAYDILCKPKNLEKLKSIINESSEYNVTIKKKSEIKALANDSDIEKLKEFAGGKLIIKD